MKVSDRVVVCGAGGFIGGHLVRYLLKEGYERVRAVDIKPVDEWFQVHEEAENYSADLRCIDKCNEATEGATWVFNLACNMGGMGFIENNKAACMLSVLINTHLLTSSVTNNVSRYFFSSSACVYSELKQSSPDVTPLRESDAYPAMPEDGYGWEKLFSERMCRHFYEDFGLETRVGRFHNVYGPRGEYQGGREKAPAAICRKLYYAKMQNESSIEVWGDGSQTRTFTYIDDCIIGIMKLMNSDVVEPLNIGSSELVSINELVDIVSDIADIKICKDYKLDAPKGVPGRSSDNTLIRTLFDWEPSISLKHGLLVTYNWIAESIKEGNPESACMREEKHSSFFSAVDRVLS